MGGRVRGEAGRRAKDPLAFKNREKSLINKRIKFRMVRQSYPVLSTESPGFVSLYTKITTKPQLKLCDVTGLQANYACPRTGVQYHNMEVYLRLREMAMDAALLYARVRTVGKGFNPFFRTKGL